MPTKAVEDLGYPPFGRAHLSRDGQELPGLLPYEDGFIECNYSIDWDLGHVCFLNGWMDFKDAANIGWESLLLIKIETMQEFIGLNVIEIIN